MRNSCLIKLPRFSLNEESNDNLFWRISFFPCCQRRPFSVERVIEYPDGGICGSDCGSLRGRRVVLLRPEVTDATAAAVAAAVHHDLYVVVVVKRGLKQVVGLLFISVAEPVVVATAGSCCNDGSKKRAHAVGRGRGGLARLGARHSRTGVAVVRSAGDGGALYTDATGTQFTKLDLEF